MKFRFASMATAAALLFSGLATTAPAANAVPYPATPLEIYSQAAVQNPSNNTVYGHAATLYTPDGSAVPPGSTATVTYASCGQVLETATYGLDDSADGSAGRVAFLHYFGGSPQPMGNSITSKIGPVLDWSATIQYPGFDAHVISNSYSGYTVKRPSCAEILNGTPEVPDTGNKLVVKKWSTKVQTARTAKVGKVVRVTKTVSNGNESYRWYVGKKVVAKGLKVRLKAKHKGKVLKMKVVASKGNEAKSRTLKFGRVKR